MTGGGGGDNGVYLIHQISVFPLFTSQAVLLLADTYLAACM